MFGFLNDFKPLRTHKWKIKREFIGEASLNYVSNNSVAEGWEKCVARGFLKYDT